MTYPGNEPGRDGAEVVPLRPGNIPPPEDGEPPAAVPAMPVTPRPGNTPGAAPAAADEPPVIEGQVIPVDQPGRDRGDWLADLEAKARSRRPVIHPALRSRAELAATATWIGQHYAHVTAFHAVRLPVYGGKLALRSPAGLARLVSGTVRWTFDLEGTPVRAATIIKADPDAYLKLSRQRDARVRLRVWVSGFGLVIASVAGGAVWLGPGPLQVAAIAAVAVVLGRLGAPADRPIISPAVVPARVTKLTSDIVIRALGSLGIAAIIGAIARGGRDAIEFKAPISRDGPGWRADLDLPEGVTVAEVMDRREKPAAALRRQLGCVWPEADHGQHPGRLILWVGDHDLSKTRQPAWPLARHGTADLFKAIPLGTDQRGRVVTVTLMFASLIIGSIPRMGKTFLLRLLALAASLDVRAELHLYDFKGTGDLAPLACVAHRYRAGDDEEDLAYAIASFRELREEMRRRTKVIRGLPTDICPANRVTPELANNRSLRLHPIFVGVDECQVPFEHPKYGAEFEEICTDLAKRGPALGIFQVLATQRPDAKSIPTGVSANVVLRMCLKVMGQTENDMVLGTSAYKNGTRATMFAFEDKGIFWFSGEGAAPRIVRGFSIDAQAAEPIANRARALRERAGTITGHAAGQEPEHASGPAFDLLADIAAVLTEPKLWNELIVDRLAGLRLDAYGPWSQMEGGAKTAQLTTALRPYGVRTGQVWGTTEDGKGANRRGVTRDDILKALTERDRKRGDDPAA